MMQQPSQGPLGASRGLIAEDACSSESTHVCDYDNLEGQDQDIECMEMLSAPDWRTSCSEDFDAAPHAHSHSGAASHLGMHSHADHESNDIEDAQPSCSHSDDDLDGNDSDSGSPDLSYLIRRFCTNCTGQMSPHEPTCDQCGHDLSDDERLFSGHPSQASSSSDLPSLVSLPALLLNPESSHASDEQASASHDGSGVQRDSRPVLLWDDRMLLHEEQGGSSPHPERPDRLRAVVSLLLESGLGERCRRVDCRAATTQELACVHSRSLITAVQSAGAACDEHGRQQPDQDSSLSDIITPDMYMNQHTSMCAGLAAGSSAEVAMMVARGEAPHGAAIVRPPGHHAESGMAMGFCFFNNAAVAAKAAQAAGARRVIILDWDIHHGNGTQHIFEDDPSVLYMSLHRHEGGRFYPGTGSADEVGLGAGEGFTVNVPWAGKDMGNGDYIAAFHQVLVPIAYEFNPDLIIVSAGFDAADGDPIGECRVTPECFAHLTSMLKAIAPVVIILEGGYNLDMTARSTEACLRVLLGETPPMLPGPRYASTVGCRGIHDALTIQSHYWKSITAPVTHSWEHASLLTLGRSVYAAQLGSCAETAGSGGRGSSSHAEPEASEPQPGARSSGVSSAAAVARLPISVSHASRAENTRRRSSSSLHEVDPQTSRRQGDRLVRQLTGAGKGAGGSSGHRESVKAGCKRAPVQSRKQLLLLALHKRAVEVFWKRRRLQALSLVGK